MDPNNVENPEELLDVENSVIENPDDENESYNEENNPQIPQQNNRINKIKKTNNILNKLPNNPLNKISKNPFNKVKKNPDDNESSKKKDTENTSGSPIQSGLKNDADKGKVEAKKVAGEAIKKATKKALMSVGKFLLTNPYGLAILGAISCLQFLS